MGQFRERLKGALIDCHKYGDFTLSSSNKASDYFDLAPLFLSPEGLRAVSAEVMSMLDGVDFDAIGCLELCPIPLVGAALVLSSKDKLGFVVRKGRKGHGTDNLVEGNLRSGSRVVILEDVTSTGQSVMKAIRAVEELGCKVVLILTIINRQEGCDELMAGYNFWWLFNRKELESE